MVESQPNDDIIEMTEEVEGNTVGTRNYRFSKIGEPVPIKPDADSEFDPQNPPSQPLAVSERYGLIFVAHSTGFCVARTKDVMESAKEGDGGSSVQGLSVVDVPIGKVSILAVCADSSTLAATVGGDLHFFAVTALLNQEQKPSLSVSLGDSICIKDMRWTTRLEKNYLLLSINGKLYYGVDQDPLKDVMDNVDAIEWSVKGKLVAVARKSVLSILSSKFREKLSMSLSLKSLIGDPDVNYTIKVDSIRWVRPDCIIVGCFQVTADGKEENYLVQVITSKEGKITKASKPIVLSFNDAFLGFMDDAVPYASGPHMFLNYLDQCKIAFAANRKNMDLHIVLFGWALDDNEIEAAMIDIQNDAWVPKINSQGNGDDNLVLGLCVDKVSHDKSITLVLGDEDKEVSPCCILLCVTVDGKLTMFHFFSAAGVSSPPPVIVSSDGKEEDTSPSESGLTKISPTMEEKHMEKVSFELQQSQEVKEYEVHTKRGDEIPMKKDQQPPPAVDQSSMVSPYANNTRKTFGDCSANKEVSPLINSKTFKGGDDVQQKVPAETVNQDRDVQLFSGTNLECSSLSMKSHHEDPPGPAVQDFSKTDTQKLAEAHSGANSFSGNFLSDRTTNQSIQMDLQKGLKELPGKLGSSSLQSVSSQSSPSSSLELTNDGKSLQKNQADNSDTSILSTGHFPGTNLERSLLSMKSNHEDPRGPAVRDFSKTDTQKLAEAHSGANSFSGNFLSDRTTNQSIQMDLQKGLKELPGKLGSSSLQSVSSQSLPSSSLELSNDGRSLQKNQSDNSDTSILSTGHFPGGPLQNPSRSKEFSGPSSTSVHPSHGNRTSAGLGSIQSLPAVHSSQLPLQENLTSGRSSSNYKPHSNKDNFRTPSPSVPLNSGPNLSKQFLNVEEMAKKLDTLLECIEGEGGFKDTSIALQKSSVVALEEGIWTLSERCRMWRGIMDERLEKIQLLLDKTVQVLARKIYMEGIVKQATDSRYWDLWNLQKLSPELELKQRHILEVNQELTNQLIELERHFNTLELNKFGENGGVQMNRRAFPGKHGPSRDVQSLHSLRNTMNAQLAAAEQLSECLSKHMSVLSIEPSSSMKKENVRRELFETIGIPYDNSASFNSPAEPKHGITLSAVSKERSQRNQSSAVKSSEPETVRRCRGSLDRNWASFEPPKTTVKRMLLQEDRQKASPNRSSLLTDKPQFTTTHLLEVSAVARANKPSEIFGPMKHGYSSKGIEDTPRKQYSESPSTAFLQWGDKHVGMSHHPNVEFSALSSRHSASSQLTAAAPAISQSSSARDFNLTTTERSTQPHVTPSSSVPMRLPTTQTFLGSPSEISVPKETGGFSSQSTTTIGNFGDRRPIFIESSSSLETGRSLKFPFSSSVSAASSSVSGSSFSLPMLGSSSAPSSSPLQPKPSNTTTTTAAPTTSSKANNNNNNIKQAVSQSAASSSSTAAAAAAAFSSSVFPSPSSFPSSLKQGLSSTTTPPSTILASKSLNTEEEVPRFSLKTTDENTTTKVQAKLPPQPAAALATGTSSNLKVEPTVVPSRPATEPLLTSFGSSTTPTVSANVALNNPKREEPSTAPPVASSSSATLSSSSGAAFTQEEDEMEEEAPEMSNSTSSQSTQQLALGNFGGFGIGSAQTPNPSTAPKQNPFGASLFANNTASPPLPSSQFTMTVPSGELFRPASFSFPSTQPPPQPTTSFGAFSGGGFGQPPAAPSGGSGQQALGSVLGTFGQSRQFGTGLPGSSVTPVPGGFGSGVTFGGNQATSGFSNAAATGGGFANLASAGGGGGGGFAAAATASGGFAAAAATSGSGFAGAASAGGFAGAGSGSGFGGFGNQQGSGGFSAFGSGGGTGRPPSELFTQIRK